MSRDTLRLVRAASIAAIYAALTILLAPISYGPVQCRISEALTVLPVFSSMGIPGLFVGCLIANLFGGGGLLDIVFGSLATLLGAIGTFLLRRHRFLAPLPPVLFNALIVGGYLHFLYAMPLFLCMLYVGIGEAVACYGIGLPLSFLLDRYQNRLF